MPERLTRYDLDALPGGALIREGLADLEAGQQYRRLRAERGDAYARYNSLIRGLTSFQSALIRAVRTTDTTG